MSSFAPCQIFQGSLRHFFGWQCPLRLQGSREKAVRTVRTEVMGCPIDDLSMASLIDCMVWAFESRTPTWYTSINVANWYACRKSDETLSFFRKAPFVSADGKPIALASRMLGKRSVHHIPAMDLFHGVMLRLQDYQPRVFLLGGLAGVAERSAIGLVARYPGVRVVGCSDGYIAGRESSVLADILTSRAQVLLLGMGTPREQRWCIDYLSLSQVSLAIGIGGGFDILEGRKKRAPQWMRRVSAEWVYRLLNEPRRLGPRYAVTNTAFVLELSRTLAQTWWKRNNEGA